MWLDNGTPVELTLLGKSLNKGEFRFYNNIEGIDNIRLDIIKEWKKGLLFWNGPSTLDNDIDTELSHRGFVSRQVAFDSDMQPMNHVLQDISPLSTIQKCAAHGSTIL